MVHPKTSIEPGIRLAFTKLGEKRYEVRLKDGYGRYFPAKWFDRLIDARRHKALLQCDRMRGQRSDTVKQRKKLFHAYWHEWLNECRGGVSPGWKREQIRIGEVYILPRIGHMPLSDIRSRDIGGIIELARSKGRGPAMLRHVYNVVHKAFEDSIEHFEYLDSSPVIRRYCPKVPRTKRNFLHPNQCSTLLMHVRGHFLEPALMLGLMAGLRPSEIQALTWENVDLESAQINICAAYKRRSACIEPFPKQKDHGRATIPKPLLEYLKTLSLGKSPEAFVAPGHRGGMLSYHVLHSILPTLCKGAGVTVVTPHELRHSCTELWVFNGANQEDCGRQLNHANASTTERYMHRTSDRLTAIGSNFDLPGYGERPKPGLRLLRQEQLGNS